MARMKPGMAIAVGFFSFVVFATIVWALTTDQIVQNVYDSATTSLKVTIVP